MKYFVHTALAALALAAVPAAQADYVLEFQNVQFTFSKVDPDSFTLRIQNFLTGPGLAGGGDWASATHLFGLGFHNIGNLSGITSLTVTENPNFAGNSWTYTNEELNANDCLGGTPSADKLCAFTAPVMPMTDDVTLRFDLTGATIDLDPSNPVHLKAQFQKWYEASGKEGTPGYKPAGFDKVGSLMSQDMVFSSSGSSGGGQSSGGTSSSGRIPEPSSNALALLALGLMGLGFWKRSTSAGK